jgi:hypothetical protein
MAIMSGSSSSRDQTTLAETISNEDAFTFRVEGMAGIHHARTIGKAFAWSLPSARIVADPGSRLVSATGMFGHGKLSVIAGEAGSTALMPRVGKPDPSSIRTKTQELWAVGGWAAGSGAAERSGLGSQGVRAIVQACIGSAAD